MGIVLWLTVRRARKALRSGQPDAARRLLDPYVAQGCRSALQALREVAGGYLARGEATLAHGNADAAWHDLLHAEALAPADPHAAAFRTSLIRLGLAECRGALNAGSPVRALEAVARLRQRPAHHPLCDEFDQACRSWLLAADAADRGEFAAAQAQLVIGRDGLPPDAVEGVDAFAADLTRRGDRYRAAVDDLHAAAEAGRWADVLRAADDVTAVAPNHRDARNLKARAWAKVQPGSGTMPALRDDAELEPEWDATAETKHFAASAAGIGPPTAIPVATPPASVAGAPGGLPKRFVLWIDGVGGYLVCLGSRITFGQATAQGPVDVPLFADVSRLHAELSRDGEGYVLESAREVTVNGVAAKRVVLKANDRVTLGGTCQFVFHKPVPISPSAKLELVSGHRLPVAVDGILLMAENLILGPGGGVHVPLPDAGGNVILYRSKDGLGVRFAGPFKVDNRPCRDRADLPVPCAVTSDSFSFAIEAVGPRL